MFERLERRPEGRRLSRRQKRILFVLAEHPELDPDDLSTLHDLAEKCTKKDEAVAAVLTHPKAPPEFWRRRILSEDPVPETILMACIRSERIRRDPAVRGRLVQEILQSKQTTRLEPFVRDADPADCAELLRRMPRSGPLSAEDLIIRSGHEIAHCLTIEDLQPFLMSPKQEVRMAAITCVSRIRQTRTSAEELSQSGRAEAGEARKR